MPGLLHCSLLFIHCGLRCLQDVAFYVLSNDIGEARKKLLTPQHQNYTIYFPGEGDISSPGKTVYISNARGPFSNNHLQISS